jgi:hypothetical protein
VEQNQIEGCKSAGKPAHLLRTRERETEVGMNERLPGTASKVEILGED